ncbi:MAG: hypothetical protein J6P48_02955 [Oscillospiraceae bacterium]|nr:hypothetical protein [Oscillospiraceae bacterium]
MAIEKLNENVLDQVSGGMSKDLQVAYAVVRGDYGNGQARINALTKAGYDYNKIQRLVNGLVGGYDKVAQDVINGKYGNGAARVTALKAAGYDAALVQDIVNAYLIK